MRRANGTINVGDYVVEIYRVSGRLDKDRGNANEFVAAVDFVDPETGKSNGPAEGNFGVYPETIVLDSFDELEKLAGKVTCFTGRRGDEPSDEADGRLPR